mmetsp:Transcript_39784/g.93729  ORF Transcript_39784/g.93729 Transcript_39784/m.93729 type:complete len:408 (-) Transcript_39784:977-2200(-)
MAHSLIISHRGVWPHHNLIVNLCTQEHVHACGQAQAHCGRGQAEAEDSRVCRHLNLLYQWKLLHLAGVEEDILLLSVFALKRLLHATRLHGADAVLLQKSPCLGGVHCSEVLSCILSSNQHDAGCTTRVLVQVLGAVIDLVLDHDPHITLSVVLGDLLLGKNGTGNWRCADSCYWCCGLSGAFCQHWGTQLPGPVGAGRADVVRSDSLWTWVHGAVPLVADLPRHWCHPTGDLITWNGRVLEPQRRVAIAVGVRVHLDAEDAVVHLANAVPRKLRWLHGVGGVDAPAADPLALQEPLHLHLRLPPCPAPVLLCGSSLSNRILWPGELGQLPCLALIQGDLCPNHLLAATNEGIARHSCSLSHRLGASKMQDTVVAGLEHGRVELHVVDDVLVIVPPALSHSRLGVNV